MDTSRSTKAISEDFPIFMEEIQSRAITGATEYGDISYDRPLSELVGEAMEELADVCGWSFILWTRLRRLQARIFATEG